MRNLNFPYVTEFLISHMQSTDTRLDEIKKYAVDNRVPIIEDEVYDFIRFILKLTRPERILEVGSAIGYSAIAMALACDEIKEIVTIELDEATKTVAEKNINELGLSDKIKLMLGDAREVIPQLDGTFDFAFIDASKGHYLEFYNLIRPMLANGGIILCDNVFFNGSVINDEFASRRNHTIVKRMREFIDIINDDCDTVSTLLPIGDGVMLIMEEKND